MLMSGKSLFRAPLQLESGVLMPQVYQGAGYRTFATGKWHNGIDAFQRCFREAEAVFFGGAARSHVQVPVQRMVDGLMEPYDAGDTFSTVLFADAAIAFLQRPSTLKQPFFCLDGIFSIPRHQQPAVQPAVQPGARRAEEPTLESNRKTTWRKHPETP